MSNINIFALGGQDENGKNCYVIEVEESIFVVNAGIKVPVNNLNGIDGIICDISYLTRNIKKIKGIFLTHTHDEVFAAIPWLIMDLPGITIYGSKFSIEVAKERVSKYKIDHKDFNFEILKENNKFDDVNLKTFELANSIAGSLALNFQTPDGDILILSNHTNDDLGIFGKTDFNKIKRESNNILALLLDARRSNYHGLSSTKKSVVPLIEHKFSTASNDQRIIVSAYDEEMFTLWEVITLARKYNRPIAIYGRTFDFLYKSLHLNQSDFIDFKNIDRVNNCVILVTGTWSRLYQRIYRIGVGEDVFLKLKTNDIIIQIAPPVNGLEVQGAEALDQVARTTYDITDVTDKEFYPTRPTRDDIKEIVKIFKPKFLIPISALYRYLVVAINSAIEAGLKQDQTIILKNGKIVYLKDGKIANQKGKIKEFGDVLIDGFGVGDISMEVINERKTLGSGGLVSISTQIDRKTRTPIGMINIQLLGVAGKSELKNISEKVKSVVIQKIEEQEDWDLREIQNSIRKRVRKVVSKITLKEPLVVVIFIEV